jgi:hypothetical protein
MSSGRPITRNVLQRIEQHIDTMRWADHVEEAIPGSLADEFWNRDLPRLVAHVKMTLDSAPRVSDASAGADGELLSGGFPVGEVGAETTGETATE